MHKPDWNKAPTEAQWYQSATGEFLAAWFCRVDGIYFACLENSTEWFEEVWQEECKEWQWEARP